MKIYMFEPSSPSSDDSLSRSVELFEREFLSNHSRFSIHTAGEMATVNPVFPYLSSDDRKKAETFNELLSKNENLFVWFTRGGYGASRWASRINSTRITERIDGKTFIGFSDTTFIASMISKAGGSFLHGPMACTLAGTDFHSRQALYRFMETGELPALRGTRLASGSYSGILTGGNLTCLCHTIGTKYEPDWHGKILFLEECNEELYRIDRMLTHLSDCGVFQRVGGIALGTFLTRDGQDHLLENLFADRLTACGKPVLTGLPAGHGHINMPMLLGMEYHLDADTGMLVPVSSCT